MIPDRAKLAALRPDTLLSVPAGELLALVMLADWRTLEATESREPHLVCVPGRSDRENGSEGRGDA